MDSHTKKLRNRGKTKKKESKKKKKKNCTDHIAINRDGFSWQNVHI